MELRISLWSLKFIHPFLSYLSLTVTFWERANAPFVSIYICCNIQNERDQERDLKNTHEKDFHELLRHWRNEWTTVLCRCCSCHHNLFFFLILFLRDQYTRVAHTREMICSKAWWKKWLIKFRNRAKKKRRKKRTKRKKRDVKCKADIKF